jgi:hypothetical protein
MKSLFSTRYNGSANGFVGLLRLWLGGGALLLLAQGFTVENPNPFLCGDWVSRTLFSEVADDSIGSQSTSLRSLDTIVSICTQFLLSR